MPPASCSRARSPPRRSRVVPAVHPLLLRASRARHGPQHRGHVRARARTRSIYGFGESFTRLNKRGQRVVAYLRDAMGVQSSVPVQGRPVLPEQSRLRDVRAHERARHLRRRRRVRLAQHDLQRRRAARPLRLPRRAEGHRLGVHGDHRPQPRAAALVVRALDEPHHLQVGSRSPRRRGEAAAVQDPGRRAAPRHRLVRDRLAERLPVLEVALHRSGEDDPGSEEGGLPHQPLAVHLLHAEERALAGARRSGTRREGPGRAPRRRKTRCSTSPTRQPVEWYQAKIGALLEDGRRRDQGRLRRGRAARGHLRLRAHRLVRAQPLSRALQRSRLGSHEGGHRRRHHLGAQRVGGQPALSAALGRRRGEHELRHGRRAARRTLVRPLRLHLLEPRRRRLRRSARRATSIAAGWRSAC